MVTNKQPHGRFSKQVVHTALVAACAAIGLALAGCDASIETANAARRDSDDAARRAASAGDPRPTKDLYEKVEAGSMTDAEAKANWKKYVEQQTAEKDLQQAVAKVTAAAKSDVTKATKSSLEAQAGSTQLQMSQASFASLQDDVAKLMQQAAEVQTLAQQAVMLGQQADVLAKAASEPKGDDVAAAKAALQERQAAVAKAQETIKKLQDDAAAKQAQAKQIYAATDAAFDAADKLKGKQAIDAGNKAMEDRKAADTAIAEASAAQPQIDRAQADLALAQVQLKSAEEVLDITTKGFEQASAASKNAQTRVAALRDGAKKIIKDKGGVEDGYKKLIDLAAGLDAKISEAAKAADAAASSFTAAVADAGGSQSELKTIVETSQLDGSDPLNKLSKDDRLKAMLTWSKAAALEQAGRVNLAGYVAAKMAGMAADSVAQAYKGAGLSDSVAKPALVAKTYGDAASDKFKQAAAAAASANTLPSPNGSELDRIKWLGYGLEAVAQQGVALSTENAGDKTAAMTAAKTAQGNAAKRNPDMAARLDPLLQ